MKNKTEKVIFKKLNLKKDITTKYQNWMNDPKINEYTEQDHKKHSLNDIRKFVRDKNKSKKDFLYGIFIKKDNSNIHIGNMKLGPIDSTHKSARISYFIGEKKLWGKGYATLAIKELTKKAKKKGLKKLKAGLYEVNIGSKKALVKNGYKLEGKLKSEIYFQGKRIDLCLFGKIL
jgi:RimJ/RimL family protein N-acetyltransferase